MAGDELVPAPDLAATRALDIDAPPADVWPWVAQIGQNRGGFYSYDAVENLVGCDIHSADTVVAAWQHPHVGDAVHLHPGFALRVGAVEPGEALVLHGDGPVDGDDPVPFDFSWAFVVQPSPDDPDAAASSSASATRTGCRGRVAWSSRWPG
jgi:hypothetical protein